MASTRSASVTASDARDEILTGLKNDHKRLKKAYRDFKKLDIEEDPARCKVLVTRVLDELGVHAALEEELLYPAARGAVPDDLLDEAEVEHESLHVLIKQLREMVPVEDKYAARFTVLCEYLLRHIKEEEGELFPRLETAPLDWPALAARMRASRAQLTSRESAKRAASPEPRAPSGTPPAAGLWRDIS